MVIQSYLLGEGSYEELSLKYKIPARSTVRKWVMKYNGHEKLRASRTGGGITMTNGRKTTFEERIEIVQFCISHKNNYAETAEKYQISYQQARNYITKYESGGIEALKDNRGKRKSEDKMSELERLRAENKILRAQKERAEMEVSFLKKLKEVERRRD
jgi:transposase-like protein